MRIYLVALSGVLAVGLGILFAQNTSSPATPAPVAAVSPQITIDASAPRTPVSPELYGIFFEEISHAGEGGLYAELVQNRDFEGATVPQGWQVDGKTLTTAFGWKTDLWFTDDLPGWSLVKEAPPTAPLQRDDANPLNLRNPHSLRVTATKLSDSGRIGVANSGFWGMNIQNGQSYDGSLYARIAAAPSGRPNVPLALSLESADGKTVYAKTTLNDVGSSATEDSLAGTWHKFTFSMQATGSDPKARLVISVNRQTTLWLDCVSLMPRNTFKNHGLRPDLAQMLVDLKPAFIRFPGGCIVEGVTLHNRIRWEDSIGDISQRQGDFELWGYYNHYGLGFHEFLQLCEDLGSEAMYVVNAGLSCQLRRPYELATDADLHLYVEDTLNALEYAMGPITSKYGAMRAANGHAAPFKIKYVEIGNENWGPNYEQHNYPIFYNAIKAKYPGVITIADSHIQQQPVEVVDDHFYVAPQHFYELANYYDTTDRKGPQIYVGEYAVNRDVGKGNLTGALAEAAFMMNMEKNSDIVKMCSYAPLFENVNKADWPVNLIRFDSSRVIGRSSYYVQKLFANNRPDFILKTDVQSGSHKLVTSEIKDLYALAGLDQKTGEIILKVVNSSPNKITAPIAIKGTTRPTKALIITLANSDPKAENTLDGPNTVVPETLKAAFEGNNISYDFPANSLTILRFTMQP